MIKIIIYLSVFILFVIGTYVFVMGRTGVREVKEEKLNQIQIVLYENGKERGIDTQSPYFDKVFSESEQLFLTADSSYRLIMTPDRIGNMKKQQVVLEVRYPHIQTGTIKNQYVVYFTKLLIPLTGEFSNGTVFFAGAYANRLDGKPEYSALLEYGATNFVHNTHGLQKLKEILHEASIAIDG